MLKLGASLRSYLNKKQLPHRTGSESVLNKRKGLFLLLAVILFFAVLPGIRIIADAFKKEKAYQFVVNGETWFTVAQKDSLEEILDGYKKQYLENIDENAKVKSISFLQTVEIIETEVKPEEVDSLKVAKERINAIEGKATEVKVKKGDNLWDLAKTNNITVAELEILNPDIDPEKIYPGDKLVVKPFKPVLDVIVELENKITESIAFNNEYKKTNSLYKNQRQTVRKGVEGQKEVGYNITLHNGYQSSIEIMEERIIKEPVNAIIHIGTKTTVSRGGRVNYGVVQGKRISSLYGNRIHPITGRRRFHEGIDIAAPHGNGVYAYTSGKIVQAGWNGGYGLSILIDHGNGLKTRYAHLSKIGVRIGQRVETGDRIGAIGSTGNSTGPHLHFEVIKNGRTQNPLNYI